jgi:hypothetical protein
LTRRYAHPLLLAARSREGINKPGFGAKLKLATERPICVYFANYCGMISALEGVRGGRRCRTPSLLYLIGAIVVIIVVLKLLGLY